MLFTQLRVILDVSAPVSCIANLHAACKYSGKTNLYTAMMDSNRSRVWRGLARTMETEVMGAPSFEKDQGTSCRVNYVVIEPWRCERDGICFAA